MRTKDFYFDLPPELIAQEPSAVRGNDRLMLLNRATGATRDCAMADLPDLLPKNALLVFNNSKVRKSRVFGQNADAAKPVEFLFINALDAEKKIWKVVAKNAKRQKTGKTFSFPDGTRAAIVEQAEFEGSEFRALAFDFSITETWFEQNGHVPLPPYIKREDRAADAQRYQTIYAKETGSAAAPTAGLHFTQGLLDQLTQKGCSLAWVTLHVGLGTFLPVRSEHIEEHTMHQEEFFISEETARQIEAAKTAGRPIIAVGTTSMRTLESAWDSERGCLTAGLQATSIFIYPGYQFKLVNGLFTNFHTPESTLLMLVSAFAGREAVIAAYEQAIQRKYRFFSYGDAMLIL